MMNNTTYIENKTTIIISIAILLFITACSNTTTHTQNTTNKYAHIARKPSIKWYNYSEKRLQIAKELKKPVFLLFSRNNCSACNRYKEKVLNNPQIIEIVNKKFIPILVSQLNVDFFDIAETYNVDSVPTAIIIKTDNTKQIKIIGTSNPQIILLFLSIFS